MYMYLYIYIYVCVCMYVCVSCYLCNTTHTLLDIIGLLFLFIFYNCDCLVR